MTDASHVTLFSWCLVAVQAAGLLSAGLARLVEGSRLQTPCQRLFLGCLGLVGVATMGASLLSPGACLISGTTLAVMALATTWDVGHVGRLAE